MTEQEAAEQVSNLLETANSLINEAGRIGKEYGIPVDFNKLAGVKEDMWYVDYHEYRQEQLEELKAEYEYAGEEITPEVMEQFKERMQEVQNTMYDGDYKVIGWMSSSTNC